MSLKRETTEDDDYRDDSFERYETQKTIDQAPPQQKFSGENYSQGDVVIKEKRNSTY